MVHLVRTNRGAAIVVADKPDRALSAIWQADAVKEASIDEIRQWGSVIVLVDEMTAEDERRVQVAIG